MEVAGNKSTDALQVADFERIHLLHALDLAGLDETAELGDGLPFLLLCQLSISSAFRISIGNYALRTCLRHGGHGHVHAVSPVSECALQTGSVFLTPRPLSPPRPPKPAPPRGASAMMYYVDECWTLLICEVSNPWVLRGGNIVGYVQVVLGVSEVERVLDFEM